MRIGGGGYGNGHQSCFGYVGIACVGDGRDRQYDGCGGLNRGHVSIVFFFLDKYYVVRVRAVLLLPKRLTTSECTFNKNAQVQAE